MKNTTIVPVVSATNKLDAYIAKKAEEQSSNEWSEFSSIVSTWFATRGGLVERSDRTWGGLIVRAYLLSGGKTPNEDQAAIEQGLKLLAEAFRRTRKAALHDKMVADLLTKADLMS